MSNIIDNVLGTDEHPIFTPANCVNRRQRKFTCTVCHELCPEDVFSMDSKKPLQWDKCINCGICVSACPSRAFVPGARMQKEYTEDLDLSKPVSFSCYKETQLCTKTVECIAGVPWELFAALALYTDVVVYTGKCDDCKHSQRCDRINSSLDSVRLFLGDSLYDRRVHVLKSGAFKREEDSAENGSALSRRDMIANFKKSLVKSAYKVAAASLPFLDPAERDGLQYRKLLSDIVAKKREEARKAAAAAGNNTPELPKYGLMLPRFTVNCIGCRICEKICPHKAIDFGPLENGKRIIYMTPRQCTVCTLCINACPYGGLSSPEPIQVPFMDRLPLVRVNSAECSSCGVAIKPGTENGMCPACTAKSRKKLR